MSITPTAEHRLQDLRDWVVAVTGLADSKVLIAPVSTGPRPALPYATVTPIVWSVEQGLTPETRLVATENGEEAVTFAHRRSVYQVDVYGAGGSEVCEAMRLAVYDGDARALMQHGTPISVSDPRYVPALMDTVWEDRVLVEVVVAWVAERRVAGVGVATVQGTIE